MTILLEEPDEEECTDTLVAVCEWMILDDKIEKVCCLLLDSRIEVHSIECCDDRGEDTDKTLILLITKYIVRL